MVRAKRPPGERKRDGRRAAAGGERKGFEGGARAGKKQSRPGPGPRRLAQQNRRGPEGAATTRSGAEELGRQLFFGPQEQAEVGVTCGSRGADGGAMGPRKVAGLATGCMPQGGPRRPTGEAEGQVAAPTRPARPHAGQQIRGRGRGQDTALLLTAPGHRVVGGSLRHAPEGGRLLCPEGKRLLSRSALRGSIAAGLIGITLRPLGGLVPGGAWPAAGIHPPELAPGAWTVRDDGLHQGLPPPCCSLAAPRPQIAGGRTIANKALVAELRSDSRRDRSGLAP